MFQVCVASQKHDAMGTTHGMPCLCPPPFWDRFLLAEFLGSDWVLAQPGAVWVSHVSYSSVAALDFQCIFTSVLITACHLTRLKKKRLRSKWHSWSLEVQGRCFVLLFSVIKTRGFRSHPLFLSPEQQLLYSLEMKQWKFIVSCYIALFIWN